MAGSVNKCILVGKLGRDPEVRTMQSGDKVVSFSLATSESWRSKETGDRQEKTTWHNIVIFNDGLGKIAEQYLKKGSGCYVEGQIQNREYTDKDGNKRAVSEVVLQKFRGELTLLDSRPQSDAQEAPPRQQTQSRDFGRTSPNERRPTSNGGSAGRIAAQIDDDIPFARPDTP